VRLALRPVRVALRSALVTAYGKLSERELLLVELSDPRSGLRGHGEAAPLSAYDGVSLAEVKDAIAACGPLLAEADRAAVADEREREALLAECERLAAVPQALAAIDMALWDLAGQAAAAPLWRLLGARRPPAVKVNWSLAAGDRAGAAREAASAVARGFETVKLKVAVGDDAGRLAAVRAAGGPGLAIRLDANGGWRSEAEAIGRLRELGGASIECCEELVHGAEAIERVAAACAVAVAIDESAAEPAALASRRCAAICLKVGRCGGVSGLLRTAARARELGYEIYLASAYDGPLGIAAALHAAAAICPERACGLATLALFAGREDPLVPAHGTMTPPTGAGLGPGLAGWYEV